MRKSFRNTYNPTRGGGKKSDPMFVPNVASTSKSSSSSFLLEESLPISKTVGVLVCVDFSDYLVHSLAVNTGVLDEIIIVTNLEDTQTEDLCLRYPNVTVLKTNCF